MASEGSSKTLELRLGDGEEILATLTNGDGVFAAVTRNEAEAESFKFHCQGYDDETILVTGATAVELGVKVGDRWLKTEDLDVMDEDDIASLIGGLCASFLQAGFAVPNQDGVVEDGV